MDSRRTALIRRVAGGAFVKERGARHVALRVLLAWEDSRHTADALLSRILSQAELAPRDHDLAIELVRGVFRWRGRLDWQLASLVHRPLRDLHPPIISIGFRRTRR
jgi:hypothetical protein